MKPIKFTTKNKKYDLKLDGTVLVDGADFGTWTTSRDNKLELVPAAGATAATKLLQPATWRTDEKNRLWVKPEGGDEVDVIESTNGNVRFNISADENQLLVKPNAGSEDFRFRLHGEWNLTEDYSALELALGTESNQTLKFIGGLADQASRFNWRYYSGNYTYDLTFKGQWKLSKVADEADKKSHVVAVFAFTYATGVGNKNDEFSVPVEMSVGPNQNKLILSYDKTTANGGKVSGSVEFLGRFETTSGKIGSYKIEYRLDNGKHEVAGSFKLGSKLKKDGAASSNSLEFAFKIYDRTVELTLKGRFQNKTGNNWAFEFSLHHSAKTPGESKISFKLTKTAVVSGSRLVLEVEVQGHKIDISIEYNSTTGAFQAGFDITLRGGKIEKASLLFGITFP